jgi:hypothetical protein
MYLIDYSMICAAPSRNMIAAGVPQAVAMKITGHRTDSMFWRYAIVNEEQKRAASQNSTVPRHNASGAEGCSDGQGEERQVIVMGEFSPIHWFILFCIAGFFGAVLWRWSGRRRRP